MATKPSSGPLVTSPEKITDEWLAGAIGRDHVQVLSTDSIGTGQMSRTFRVVYSDDQGQGTVVVKMPAADPVIRASAKRVGVYSREVEYYRIAADTVAGNVPECHFVSYDPTTNDFTLVLADQSGTVQGDQIAGCTPEVAALAMRAAARLHAPFFNSFSYGVMPEFASANPRKQEFLTSLLPGFIERFGDQISAEHMDIYREFLPKCDEWLADLQPPCTLAHLDFRLDNMLFDGRGGCTVVDWQTVSWGPVMTDVAFFLGGGLTTADRREHERELVREYHDEICALGIRNFSFEQAWEGYRRQTFHGLIMTLGPAMLANQTERGDLMFRTVSDRFCQQIIDLDSLSLLGTGRATNQHRMVADRDEDSHEPAQDLLWNESWYFDAVSDDGQIGVYTRLGQLPNQQACMYTAAICRPGQPSILITDFSAPLATIEGSAMIVKGDGLVARHENLEPVKRWRLRLTGTGQEYDDDADPLHGMAGKPIHAEFDLVWETDGIPYPWRNSTRYEIPCAVTGTVTIGDEVISFTGLGQRDHSWGKRDWWAADWMWCAFPLDDGSRLHAATVPSMPGFAVGYLQRGGQLTEITSGSSTCEISANGLVTSARIDFPEIGIGGNVQPLTFGALRLESPDGRLSFFPRAIATLTLDDGRSGLAWLEWKHNQSEPLAKLLSD